MHWKDLIRKKDFLAHSKGKISYIDGIKYHFVEYGFLDLFYGLGMVIVLAIIYSIAGDIFVVRVFPIAFTMFRSFGMVAGPIVAIISVCISMLSGIFFSQKKWRAEYFINE